MTLLLGRRKNPSLWLWFDPPYRSAEQGLSQLCACPAELRAVVDAVGSKVAEEWARRACPADAKALEAAARAGASRESEERMADARCLRRVGWVAAGIGVVWAGFFACMGIWDLVGKRSHPSDVFSVVLPVACLGIVAAVVGAVLIVQWGRA